jgi:hypothetical protein
MQKKVNEISENDKITNIKENTINVVKNATEKVKSVKDTEINLSETWDKTLIATTIGFKKSKYIKFYIL